MLGSLDASGRHWSRNFGSFFPERFSIFLSTAFNASSYIGESSHWFFHIFFDWMSYRKQQDDEIFFEKDVA